MGFEIDDKKLKRAGLDYWHLLGVQYYENLDDFFKQNQNINMYLCSTKASKSHTDVSYNDSDYLFFGKETKGLPESFILDNIERAIRIPMIPEARSLNLSNSVAIVLYEALRQTEYKNLMTFGKFSDKLLD